MHNAKLIIPEIKTSNIVLDLALVNLLNHHSNSYLICIYNYSYCMIVVLLNWPSSLSLKREMPFSAWCTCVTSLGDSSLLLLDHSDSLKRYHCSILRVKLTIVKSIICFFINIFEFFTVQSKQVQSVGIVAVVVFTVHINSNTLQ